VTPAITRIQAYWNRAVANLPAFGIAVLVLLIFGMLARFLFNWTTPFERMGINPLAHGLLRRLLSTILFTVGLVLALDILDVTALVGAVLGTAGIVGLALGFAFQDIVENYLAGVLMSVRNPFAINDLVKIGEHEGKVIRLTAREMVLMTLDGNHLRLPNATVFKSPIINYTRNPKRRFSFTIGVSNEVDLVGAVNLARDTLAAMKGVLEEPGPYIMIQSLGDSNVVLWLSAWVNQQTADFGKVKSEALRLVKMAFDEAGYEMPEPIYRVNLVQRTEQPPTPKPGPSKKSVEEQARTIDVSVDTELDKQVEEDLAASDEQNLLLDDGEGAKKK
jgi:small-conductance mechanosensitive channel